MREGFSLSGGRIEDSSAPAARLFGYFSRKGRKGKNQRANSN